MCSSTLSNGLRKHEHMQTGMALTCSSTSPRRYLSAETPAPTPAALQPTGQLPYPVGSQYPSSQHLYSGSGWSHQTLDPFQPPPQGIRVCS